MNKTIIVTASILGIISIVLGAFGAHGLKVFIPVEAQQTFETGVRYQMYHAVFLLFIGGNTSIRPKSKKAIYFLTLLGILLFSGSIYGLATNTLTTFNFKAFGFVTPIGGLLLISAWVVLLVNFLKIKSKYI